MWLLRCGWTSAEGFSNPESEAINYYVYEHEQYVNTAVKEYHMSNENTLIIQHNLLLCRF